MADTTMILEHMRQNAADNGYYLSSDKALLDSLIAGLATNENRYGYGSCPCRMAGGVKQYDVDIICPCEYRDADVNEFGMCYCGLFVNKTLHDDSSQMQPIPERRPVSIQDAAMKIGETKGGSAIPAMKKLSQIHVWRCTVCGYLCARELPPPVCPICKATAERFAQFKLTE
jgi:ferredoxin-thioredoxin reductase catalytic subunit